MHRANVLATMAGAESDEPQERQQAQGVCALRVPTMKAAGSREGR